MVSAIAALMAALTIIAGPAMAQSIGNENDLNNGFNVGQSNDDDLFGLDDFGVFNDLGLLDNDLGLFNADEEALDTIDVGDVECLVEDGDDVEFCVNEETGDTFNV